MVATAMLPLSMYDNGNVNADGEADEDGFFLISRVEELSKVGKGEDNPEPEYQEWTLDANYRLTQDIEFSPGDNTNGGVMIDLIITYDADDNEFTVTLTPKDTPVTVYSVNLWIGTEHSTDETITAPSDAGTYTMTMGGELSDGTFAYTVKIEVLPDMSEWSHITTEFDSNGNFDPIGTPSEPFSGTFNGAGFKISGMNVAIYNGSDEYEGAFIGLFGFTTEGTIKDLGVTDGYFIGVGSIVYSGGIVGGADSSSIENCYNTGDVIATANSGGDAFALAGGIVSGAESSSIENCYNTGDVIATATSNGNAIAYVGGIAGITASSSIENCYNTGDVIAIVTADGHNSKAHAGGIAGSTELSSITNCYNTGDVTVTADGGDVVNVHAGGIVGLTNSSSIENCYNTGDVIATTDVGSVEACAGGIAGYASSSIENCYNTGDVIATATSNGNAIAYVGGIAGYTSSSIENCYNTGDVTATGTADGAFVEAYAGGIAGYTSSSIENCYNTGDVTATAYGTGTVEVYAGGIAGDANDESIIHSYFLEKSGLELTGNAGYVKVDGDDSGSRSPDLMKKMETYTGWNFETDPIIWGIYPDINDGFPVLEAFMFDLVLIYEGDGNVIGPVRIYGGSTVTIIVIPDDGNRIKSVTDNGNDVTALVLNNEYDITNIFGDRAIKVAFEAVAVPDIDPDIDPDKRLAFIIILAMVLGTMIIVGVIMVRRRDQEEN